MSDYPDDQAVKTWEKDGVKFYIVQHPSLGHYCGYCRFPTRFLREQGYHGILTYAPVHGGITYAEEKDGAMVYGFDCGHSGDDEKPEMRDLTWLAAECERMAANIQAAAEFEERYLLAKDNEEKAAAIDEYHAKTGGFELTDNFGSMINVLFGSL